MLESIRHDLRFALRMLRKSPGFTLVAVCTLALGIGANTALFSVIDAVLLEPLPYRDTDELEMLWGRWETLGFDRNGWSYEEVRDLRRETSSFSALAAYHGGGHNLTLDGVTARVSGLVASDAIFDVLGAEAQAGRTFTPDDESRSVAVIRDGLAEQLFGSAEAAVGARLELDGIAHQVVGVMPAGFRFPHGSDVDVWTTLDESTQRPRSNRFLRVVARRKPGVTHATADAELERIAAGWGERHAGVYEEEYGHGLYAEPFEDYLRHDLRRALTILLAAVGLVLLLACANVANLLVARGSARRREMALRAALGAGRARLVRQLLTESMLLALLGGAAGILCAWWGIDALAALSPGELLPADGIAIDASVLAFSVALTMVTGVVFGLLPAVDGSRVDLNACLREAGLRASGGRGVGRLRRAIVVGQIAVALVLIAGAGLMMRSFAGIVSGDRGFDTTGVITARLSLPEDNYGHEDESARFWTQLLERAQGLPGVEEAALTSHVPLSGGDSSNGYLVEGKPGLSGPESTFGEASWRSVTPGYLEAMGGRLLRGRWIDARDDAGATPVIVVDAQLARHAWPDEDPIGRRIRTASIRRDGSFLHRWWTVVGVVAHLEDKDLDEEPREQIYHPLAQWPMRSMTLVARTRGEPLELLPLLREEVRRLDPAMVLYDEKTLAERVDAHLEARRFTAVLMSTFGALALFLAAVGLYGLMAFSVGQRTREIGIRIALGAEPRRLVRRVVGEGLALGVVGALLGLCVAVFSGRWLEQILYRVSPTDPWTLSGAAALLSGVVVVASYLPARRAARVEPAVALRCE